VEQESAAKRAELGRLAMNGVMSPEQPGRRRICLMSSRSFDLCGATPIVAGANDWNLSKFSHVEQVAVDADQ
jgi:hypothetical protein